MTAERVQHDHWSKKAASAYWQSVIFERTAMVLLGWTLLMRIVFAVALYGFGERLTTISANSDSLKWLWLTGVALLLVAAVYRVIAGMRFSKSDVMSQEEVSDFMPPVSLRKHPMTAVTWDGRSVDWDLK